RAKVIPGLRFVKCLRLVQAIPLGDAHNSHAAQDRCRDGSPTASRVRRLTLVVNKTTGRFLPGGLLLPPLHRPTQRLARSSVNLRSFSTLGFVFHVVPGGDVPTKSGGSQTERGESKKPVDQEGIRRSGGRMARPCRANGVD